MGGIEAKKAEISYPGFWWNDLEFEGLSELLNRLFACKITISSIGTYVHIFLTSKSSVFGIDLAAFSAQ